ncbi:hypothetical protein RR46_11503 [Papilio xuthus]|uniref:Uncharacterized protein n=1 Tax=Papilio xuthus TaxID=66420 RepID=A0A194PXB9_PAPXU|nr:hypothetical protein RR46_11503 [Papilio xuthus]
MSCVSHSVLCVAQCPVCSHSAVCRTVLCVAQCCVSHSAVCRTVLCVAQCCVCVLARTLENVAFLTLIRTMSQQKKGLSAAEEPGDKRKQLCSVPCCRIV